LSTAGGGDSKKTEGGGGGATGPINAEKRICLRRGGRESVAGKSRKGMSTRGGGGGRNIISFYIKKEEQKILTRGRVSIFSVAGKGGHWLFGKGKKGGV